jgi:hypothetical protein
MLTAKAVCSQRFTADNNRVNRRPFTGSELELLQNTLELTRRELVRAVEHLSDTQARRA